MLLEYLKQKNMLRLQSLASFIVVGFVAVTIYFSIFSILWSIFNINYTIAISLAYISGVLCHFFANRYFTFNSHGYHLTPHTIRYILLLVNNYLITLFIVYIIVTKLSLSPYIGMLTAIACTPIISYLALGLWVFNIADKNRVESNIREYKDI